MEADIDARLDEIPDDEGDEIGNEVVVNPMATTLVDCDAPPAPVMELESKRAWSCCPNFSPSARPWRTLTPRVWSIAI